jgi:hypothetical protein
MTSLFEILLSRLAACTCGVDEEDTAMQYMAHRIH